MASLYFPRLLGEYKKAIEYYENALQIEKVKLGEDNVDRVVQYFGSLQLE